MENRRVDTESSGRMEKNEVPVKKKYARWCFVPLCTNTDRKNPDKVFVSVPRLESIRKKWFLASNRVFDGSKSCFYCCEDHFDLYIVNL